MKIIPHWKFSSNWQFFVLSVFLNEHFWGFCLFGHTFEWPRTPTARDVHKNS